MIAPSGGRLLPSGFLDQIALNAACANPDLLGGAVDQGAYGLKVDVPAPVGQVVSVADPVPELRTAVAYFANSCHE
jgi:hypothetical protein